MDEILVHFRLIGPEAKSLRELALAQSRRPNEQVRFMIRSELADKVSRESTEAKSQPTEPASR